MRNIGLLAFGITTCVLVPTSLHFVQAGPNQVAKLFAPDVSSISIGGAKIDVTADRALVDAGGKVHVTISATADTRVKLPLTLLVYEARGTGGGRVDEPPRRVDRDDLALDVKDGKVTQTLALTLPGFRAEYMDGSAVFGHYTVLVMATKDADKLDRARRHVKVDGMDASDPDDFNGKYAEAGDAGDGQPAIARLEFATRTTSDKLRIIAPDTAIAGTDIPVKVRVTNPTKHAFAALSLTLSDEPHESDGDMNVSWAGIGSDGAQIDPLPDFALGAHETKELVVHVHAKATGTLGLFASVGCAENADDNQCDGARGRAFDDNALDAIDILPAPEQPQQTAQADAK
ncbi:MAG TPA: hypothetical protein VGG74_04320 [Kofleriaceae bacterium]|jgi:predicted secreted protein